MQALVNARSKDKPFCFRRVSPGRFSSSQPAGKCWIGRSWSVMKRMTFFLRPRTEARPLDAALASRPSPRMDAETAVVFSISLRLICFFQFIVILGRRLMVDGRNRSFGTRVSPPMARRHALASLASAAADFRRKLRPQDRRIPGDPLVAESRPAAAFEEIRGEMMLAGAPIDKAIDRAGAMFGSRECTEGPAL